MRIFFSLVLLLLSVEVCAQSLPTGAKVYGPDNGLIAEYAFTYSDAREPFTVTMMQPEGYRIEIYTDFIRMPGVYWGSPHPLFPEYRALVKTILYRNDQGELDTSQIDTETYGPFGRTSWSRATVSPETKGVQYAEWAYNARGYFESGASWSETYRNGELESIMPVERDTAIVELDGERLLSHYWERGRKRQVYTYNTDGSLATVQIIDYNSTDPQTVRMYENIKTRKYDHLIIDRGPAEGLDAIPNHVILSMNVREWSDALNGLDTANAYVAEYDDTGRRLSSSYRGIVYKARFLDGMRVNFVTPKINGDTLEFTDRTFMREGELLVGMKDTIIGINGYSGSPYQTSRRYEFEYKQADVKPVRSLSKTVVWYWDDESRSLSLSSVGLPLRSIVIRSLTGGVVFSRAESVANVTLHLPQLSPGVYFVHAQNDTSTENFKILIR